MESTLDKVAFNQFRQMMDRYVDKRGDSNVAAVCRSLKVQMRGDKWVKWCISNNFHFNGSAWSWKIRQKRRLDQRMNLKSVTAALLRVSIDFAMKLCLDLGKRSEPVPRHLDLMHSSKSGVQHIVMYSTNHGGNDKILILLSHSVVVKACVYQVSKAACKTTLSHCRNTLSH